jgi:hypothetical protein
MRLSIAIAVLFFCTTASAFVLYKSKNDPFKELHWETDSADVVIDSTAPQEIVIDVAAQVCEDGFQIWSNLVCGEPATLFNFYFQGFVSGKVVGFDEEPGAENENLIIWVQSLGLWRHGPGVLALTSLTYDTNTGEIVDGDLEFNDAEFIFSLNPSASQVDLLNTAAHEAGHFLGIDHSTKPSATMFGKAPLGEIKKRDLHSDDIDGYCALYGPGGLFPFKDKGVRSESCSATTKRGASTGALWLVFGCLLGLSVGRARLPRRRKRSRAPAR